MPQASRFPVGEQDPDVSSSDKECNTSSRIYGYRGTSGGLRVQIPLSSPVRAGSIHGVLLQTPVAPSPSMRSSSLLDRSSVLNSTSGNVDGIRQRHRSEVRSEISPLVANPARSRQTIPPTSPGDGKESSTVDLGNVQSAQMIKERLFSKFGVPPNSQSLYSIHQWQSSGQHGLSSPGAPLSDEDIVSLCQLYRESESPLMFFVRPSQSTSYRVDGVHTQEPPPLPPPHTRPKSEYTSSVISVDNENSESGSGYSGGPESKRHNPPFSTIPNRILVRKNSTSSIDFPAMPRPSIGTPPQPSMILANAAPPAPPSTVASSTDASLLANKNMETQRNNATNGNNPPLSLRIGPSLLSPRTNVDTIPPAPPPPTYSPPSPPILSFHRSSVDSRRPSESNSTNRLPRTPVSTQENVADRLFSRFIGRNAQDRNIMRPGTSVGVHNPQAARSGTTTGRSPFVAIGRPLSPILRANSTMGRPREPWASGSSANIIRNSESSDGERPQGRGNMVLRLRTGHSRRSSSRSSAVNSPVDGQRSPLNGVTPGPLTSHVIRRREASARLRSWTPRDEFLS